MQAKKDEQPANITRSYASKQREWRAWCHKPRAGPDGTLFTWLDGELVTPDKLAAWLKEDILLRRVKVLKKRRSHNRTEPPLQANKQAVLCKVEALTVTLAVPVIKAA